jgi:hypothetical protein
VSKTDTWSKTCPDEQGYWWWWNEDGPPIPVSIFASGHENVRYFATVGQHGWNRAQWVEDMGGFWMRLHEPSTVACDECQQMKFPTCPYHATRGTATVCNCFTPKEADA